MRDLQLLTDIISYDVVYHVFKTHAKNTVSTLTWSAFSPALLDILSLHTVYSGKEKQEAIAKILYTR